MKFMQITTLNGTHYQFGVSSIEEYKKKKRKMLLSFKSFVNVVETCSIRKSDIVSIEYFEMKEEQ